MVKRIVNLFYKEFSGLHEAAFLLGTFAIFSQVLALVRDRLFAHFFGAGATLDIYYAAFRLPDFLYVSLASFVSVTVLIPFFIKKIEEGEEKAKQFLNNVFTVFFVSIVTASLVLFFFIPALSEFLFRGFLLWGLWRRIGHHSFWVGSLLFALLHITKPALEMPKSSSVSSIPAIAI